MKIHTELIIYILVDCQMGEWSDWSRWRCGRKWQEECGYCRRTQRKSVVVECDFGGDCSCTEQTKQDFQNRPCREFIY